MINEQYTKEILKSITEEFKKNKSVQLLQILSPQKYAQVVKKLLSQQFMPRKIPDEFSYQSTESNPLVSDVCKALEPLIRTVTGKKLANKHIELYQQRDYTVRRDEVQRKKRWEMILDLITFDESWGGYTSIVDDSGEIARFVPTANSLTIIELDENQDSFVKYVNCLAERPRLLIRVALR